MSKFPFLAPVVSIGLFASASFGFDSEAERLAYGDSDDAEVTYYASVGVGSGALYGGLVGMGLEFGYKQIGIVVAGGLENPDYGGIIEGIDYHGVYGREKSSSRLSWKTAVKGYLGGTEMAFRPYLAAVFGPVWVYRLEGLDGYVISGTYNLFGAATGLEWRFGPKKHLSLSLGGEAFPLTRTVVEPDQSIYKQLRRDDVPFLIWNITGGLNYRF